MKPDKPEKPEKSVKRDVALIHGRTADGEGLRILRQRDDQLELGDIRPLKEGRPIEGEVVSLKPRPDFPLLCDVSVELEARQASPRAGQAQKKSGPAQVATESYRQNWDAIFRPPAQPN